MNIFKLPDLGEGLTEVEIVEWLIKPNDDVELDQPMASVETAKAIVEIPCPVKGKIYKLYGEIGDIVHVGDPLVEFVSEKSGAPQAIEKKESADTGTVAGVIKVGTEVVNEKATTVGQSGGGIKATPAVRALARRMDVDLSIVTPSGPNDTITAADVQRVAKIFEDVGAMELLRGVRRTMAKTMTLANAEVVPVTIYDDVDINHWHGKEDITTHLIKAIIAGCETEPALNAWYDSHAIGRRVIKKIDLGIAVDTQDGLFVPVLRDVGNRSQEDLRAGLNQMKQATKDRNIPPQEMRGYTFTLSNFGTFGGRYANPIVVPPTVAILGAGKLRQAVLAVNGEVVIHWVIPLSLTFDHRAVTGGEATRFLAAVMTSLGS
ncbi:Dihydrolipoamide acyltransferase component of branched-chain alpha-keto acid dehydrogenase complex [hydrothermal vent metagenome]|uniref:Dihydrolipoamide acyltransferase component of branched-chain alpha-keto acid dehydrogenase complex n=1 Tax=hydrothermal vent metagenome TaxID=652676 RepID=A0A3B0YQM1_9ZZZZ